MRVLFVVFCLALCGLEARPQQGTCDDLCTALAAHGLDPAIAPVAAVASEIAISNSNALGTRLTNDEAAIATLQKAVISGGSISAPVDIAILATPGSGTDWNMSASLAEFPGTQRKVNFAGVHQFRLCYNPKFVGGTFGLEQSLDKQAWTPLTAQINLPAPVSDCTAWAPYTGPQSDGWIHVVGANGNAGTSTWYQLSLQIQ